tara:strand:- start:3275 stop:5212 length:1938 start_codon:yes stop_codon:yes gene_type:complete
MKIMEKYKKYKIYIIAVGILILGIILGNVFSGSKTPIVVKEGEHEYIQDPVTQLWTCAMHPQIRMKEPGNCPICGMELIPMETSSANTETIGEDEVVLSEEAIQLANIQTSQVVKSNAIKEIHLLGRVQPDERKLYSQVSHIPGRIEHLYVNFTGEKVFFGQKIVRIYSPELISAQKELFEAIKSKDIYPQLYTASRNKLKLWKLNDTQIDAIEASGKVKEEIDILSDHTGYVMKRDVELGDYVKEGSVLFDIANLSTVWVMFEAYESDIQWIHLNDVFNFTIQALPGKTFNGKVTYVDPFVSAATRIAKVRVEVNNPSNTLLPEMYATGIVSAKLASVKDAIMVPKSAVLWTGKRAVVYVKVPHEKTHSFMYREVTLGADLGEYYIIKDGLIEGETVATNGVFRIDSSAQLIGKKSMMNPEGGKVNLGHAGMDMGGDKKSGSEDHSKMDMSNGKMEDKTDHSKMDMSDSKMTSKTDHTNMENDTKHTDMNLRIATTNAFKGQLEQVFNAYIKLKDALASDDGKLASTTAKGLLNAMEKVDMKQLSNHEAHNHWMTISKEISLSATSISEISDIEKQRSHFKHLSAHLSKGVKLFGVNQIVYEQFCPMADNNNGAYWLSLDKTIKNPYLGLKMPTCGDNKTVIIK